MDFDLQKKADAFTFELEKKGITNAPIMRVCAALDISGSMSDEIADGSLQSALDQLGGIAIKFDDNGEIDVWKFDDCSDYVGTWKPSDYRSYIKSAGIRPRGGTMYSPFINAIVNRMFTGAPPAKTGFSLFGFGKGKTPQAAGQEPVLVLVITDGEPSPTDVPRIEAALKDAASYPIFFAFIGMSNQSVRFPTLDRLNRDHSNVGFITMKFNQPDSVLYEQIITTKLIDFIKRYIPATV